MTTDQETLRLREAFASLAWDAVPQESCPEPERLWAGARGELAPGEVRELIEHTAACAACAESWRLAHRLDAELGEADEAAVPHTAASPAVASPTMASPAAARRPMRPAAWLSWQRAGVWAAAAAAMVLVVVGLQLRAPQVAPPGSGYRQPGTTGIQSLLTAGETLLRQELVLRWSGPEGARYRLWVTSDDGTLLAEARDLEAAEYRVPEAALADLPPGSRILWRVDADLVDGGSLASSTFSTLLE